MRESIPFFLILSFCAIILISIGIYALNKKTPMHFWSGTIVKSEEIRDVKAYNRANGIMWIVYGISFILSGFLGFIVNNVIVGIAVTICCFGGLIIMIATYNRIYKKYKI